MKFDWGIGIEDSQENRYFSRLAWAQNSKWFVMTWISRAATQAKSLACEVNVADVTSTKCTQVGREDGGSKGEWDDGKWVNDPDSNGAGWIGSFGPFTPIAHDTYKEFFAIYRIGTIKIYPLVSEDCRI